MLLRTGCSLSHTPNSFLRALMTPAPRSASFMQWELRPEYGTDLGLCLANSSGVSGLDASSPASLSTSSFPFLAGLHHSQFPYSLDSWKKVPEISGRQRKGRWDSVQGGTWRVMSQAGHPGVSCLSSVLAGWGHVCRRFLAILTCVRGMGAIAKCQVQAGHSQCPVPFPPSGGRSSGSHGAGPFLISSPPGIKNSAGFHRRHKYLMAL